MKIKKNIMLIFILTVTSYADAGRFDMSADEEQSARWPSYFDNITLPPQLTHEMPFTGKKRKRTAADQDEAASATELEPLFPDFTRFKGTEADQRKAELYAQRMHRKIENFLAILEARLAQISAQIEQAEEQDDDIDNDKALKQEIKELNMRASALKSAAGHYLWGDQDDEIMVLKMRILAFVTQLQTYEKKGEPVHHIRKMPEARAKRLMKKRAQRILEKKERIKEIDRQLVLLGQSKPSALMRQKRKKLLRQKHLAKSSIRHASMSDEERLKRQRKQNQRYADFSPEKRRAYLDKGKRSQKKK